MASTIKVDNVQNQPGTNIINKCSVTTTIGAGAGETVAVCAATVNLGRSGGTVNLTSGATQTGFGRTGTVDWITTPKVTGDSPVTGVTGKGYFLNTTAGTITINLPAGAAGSIVSLADYAGTWQTYAVTVTPNGTDKIGSVNTSVTLDTEGQSVTFVYVDSTQGWINTMDSTSNVRGNPNLVATVSGACNTLATAPDCANVKIATFTGPGTFAVTNASATAAENIVSYMVLAGGAGGGGCMGGGGGAGGFREIKSPLTPYTASPLDGYATPANHVTVTATPYPITVGGGGPGGGPGSRGTNGVNSVFSTITAAGGGGGGAVGPGGGADPSRDALDGGSGGGQRAGFTPGWGPVGGSGNTPPVSPPQGNTGGKGWDGLAVSTSGGGGGASSAVGGDGGPYPAGGGTGGAGVTSSITASPVQRAAGGGGGSDNGPDAYGGAGGGGAAGTPTGVAGTINTGSGGGGGGNPNNTGGAGGSGIVVIRYKFQ